MLRLIWNGDTSGLENNDGYVAAIVDIVKEHRFVAAVQLVFVEDQPGEGENDGVVKLYDVDVTGGMSYLCSVDLKDVHVSELYEAMAIKPNDGWNDGMLRLYRASPRGGIIDMARWAWSCNLDFVVDRF